MPGVATSPPADMNASRQVTGNSSGRAWVYDGTTASYIFSGFTESYGVAINDNGGVAGNQNTGGGMGAFTYDGTVHPFGTWEVRRASRRT